MLRLGDQLDLSQRALGDVRIRMGGRDGDGNQLAGTGCVLLVELGPSVRFHTFISWSAH